MKPKIVFFSRSYQAKLFPLLESEKYDSIHVTLTEDEKRDIENKGYTVKYCFETFRPELDEVIVSNDYLCTSFKSDRFLHKYNVTDRIEILKKEICFWRTIFDTEKPDAILNEQVAIEIAEVMYIEAKARGIKYLAWMTNPVNGYFYWTSDPISLSLDESVFNKEPSQESLTIAKDYVDRIIEKGEKPFYILPFLNISKTSNLVKSLKGVIKHLLRRIKNTKTSFYEDSTSSTWNFFERSYKSIYLRYDSLVVDNSNLILYPLHYEPEAALSYLSEFYSNQVYLIENIIKCLGVKQTLVVKEHPAQSGMLLTKKYQSLRKNNPGLVFLPSSISSFDVIKKSESVITLTSHLGWEAIILGKPVILLGKMFYDKHPQINKINTFEELREFLKNKKYIIPQKSDTLNYVANLLDISYLGTPFPSNELYDEENILNIKEAIAKALSL